MLIISFGSAHGIRAYSITIIKLIHHRFEQFLYFRAFNTDEGKSLYRSTSYEPWLCLPTFYHLVLSLLLNTCITSPFCSADLRLNQPRYATLPNIMKAKSKVIKKLTPEDLKVEIKSDIEVVKVTEPPKRKAGVLVSSVDELIDKLKNEARVV